MIRTVGVGGSRVIRTVGVVGKVIRTVGVGVKVIRTVEEGKVIRTVGEGKVIRTVGEGKAIRTVGGVKVIITPMSSCDKRNNYLKIVTQYEYKLILY